ncbi:hypothetical protein CAL26_01180 [Bordetella genomosp. 9]|uniref:HTH lysR-type domain-containing protein n=1 Tax=Bordetella genomosp. 9 TaxID=1416803 RepID=A0A261RN27_9BORD|nr:LysR family transcriptional regulator [Bordetella genomosp. 9]OZI26000.1 hypothetical protein CAL26_01180 [Bordetella genomosp. 9]
MNRYYDLVDLQVLLAVAEENNLSRGAMRCNLAPSSVSVRLKGLEEAIGARLLVREARGVALTPAGRILVEHAKKCFAQLDQMHVDLLPYARGITGNVTLFASDNAMSFLPDDLAVFFKRNPSTRVTLEERPSADIVAAVAAGRAPLGIVAFETEHPDLEYLPYRQDELVLLVPRDHDLGQRKEVPFVSCLSEPFICLAHGNALHTYLISHAAKLGAVLDVRVQVSGYRAIAQLVAAGAGVGVIPRSTVVSSDLQTLAVVKLSDPWAIRDLRICRNPRILGNSFSDDLVEVLCTSAARDLQNDADAATPITVAAVDTAVTESSNRSTSATRFPDRELRLIVPMASGGGADICMRMMLPTLQALWGHDVFVDNRAGGTGAVGLAAAKTSRPDGYTVVLCTASHAALQATRTVQPYDLLKDFEPVGQMTSTPYVLVVNPNVPVRTIADVIKLSNQNKDGLVFSSAGVGSMQALAGLLLASRGHARLLHVPYTGGGPAVAAVLSGQVDMVFATRFEAQPYIKSGKLRAIAVTSLQRMDNSPDLPTVAESGLPGFEVSQFYGLLAPAGTPRVAIETINKKVSAALQSPDLVKRYGKEGVQVVTSNPQEFRAFLASHITRFKPLASEDTDALGATAT